MLKFLKTIFGENIKMSKYNYPDETPFYIRDSYIACEFTFNKNKCVVIFPKSSWRLPVIKKHLLKFQELCQFPCALGLENMSALQRRNLVESNIPFVSLSQQVYLPFWGSCFTERIKAKSLISEKMSPGTQIVFLYIYYYQSDKVINLTQISRALNLSKATCTRAINDLFAAGLITIKTEGTNKWISSAYEKSTLLNKAYSRLRTPIERYVYVNEITASDNKVYSGILALSEISMLGVNEQDRGYAISQKNVYEIPSETIISEQEFKDFGGFVIEVWRYDPVTLSENGRVDDISLLLSLENNTDERIQRGLDDIREKHGLPVEDEE